MYYPYIRQTTGQQRIMSTIGNGSLSVEPDTVMIQLAIVTENEALQVAQAENAETSSQVIQALINIGIPQDHIQTSGFTVNPIYDFVDGNQVLRGYQVEHSLSVESQALDQTGMIIDTAVNNGVNQVSSIQFSVQNKQEYYREALNRAVKDAIEKAKSIADTINLNLDAKPIKMNEITSEQPIVYQTFAMEKGSPTTPIQPSQIVIDATIKVQFQYFS